MTEVLDYKEDAGSVSGWGTCLNLVRAAITHTNMHSRPFVIDTCLAFTQRTFCELAPSTKPFTHCCQSVETWLLHAMSYAGYRTMQSTSLSA